MILAFLPWKRLPAWLFGLLVIAIGVLILINADSGVQAEAGGLIATIGVIVFIHELKKLRSKTIAHTIADGKY